MLPWHPRNAQLDAPRGMLVIGSPRWMLVKYKHCKYVHYITDEISNN